MFNSTFFVRMAFAIQNLLLDFSHLNCAIPVLMLKLYFIGICFYREWAFLFV